MRVFLSSFLLLLSSAALAAPDVKPQLTISVNAAYFVDSLWTEDEILRRFAYTQEIYKNACGKFAIDLQLNELMPVHAHQLQEFDGWLSDSMFKKITTVLGMFRQNLRPTIIYLNQLPEEKKSGFSEYSAVALTLDGPRALPELADLPWNGFVLLHEPVPFLIGNLPWASLKKSLPLHGVALITQGSSERHEFAKQTDTGNHLYSVDGHELGHILLNDGSHRYTDRNIMADKVRNRFDENQCQLIWHYHQMEALREKAVRQGMSTICRYVKTRTPRLTTPNFCSP